MTSLSNVIAELESCKYRTEESIYGAKGTEEQKDLKPYVAAHLADRLGHLNIKNFHERHLDWIEKTQSSGLEHLCSAVAHALGSAVEQFWKLQHWASREEEYLNDLDIGRTIAVNAMGHLITTFKEFEIVPDDDELQLEANKRLVLKYLKRALRLVVTLGKLLGHSMWYDHYEEYLDQLDSFEFDRRRDCRMAANPTLQAVLDDPRSVPLNHLPRNPGRPRLYPYDGFFGPGVLVNEPPLLEAGWAEGYPDAFDQFGFL